MSAFRRPARPRIPIITLAVAACAALAAAPLVSAVPSASAAIVAAPITASGTDPYFEMVPLGSYETGTFDQSAAEIVTYHAASQRLFVVNAAQGAVDVLSISDATAPAKVFALTAEGAAIDGGSEVIPAGSTANSVAVRADGLGAMAIESPTKTNAGWLVFFDANAAEPAVLGAVTVGALPDMVSMSVDGGYAVVANEGEPNDAFDVDPEGSVSVVTLPETLSVPTPSAVATADFHAYEVGGSKTLPTDVRIFGPTVNTDFPVSANLEPEYVAIDGLTAYVALQEANAVAVVDLASAAVTDVWPLGFQDHGLDGNGIDASDKDDSINILTYPGLKGMYMPDGINAYTADDATYLVTANEGDAREWGDYADGERAEDLTICTDSALFGKNTDAEMGRLNVSIEDGYNAIDSCYDELYSFGSRSFSIWNTDGTQAFDSGDDFEQITAAANPGFFNSDHSESNLEGRSDNKGPEPENLAIGQIDGRTYAFIGLERVGGIMAYDITDPTNAQFVTYLNNRDFQISVEDSTDVATDLPLAGDLGPEGVTFISAADSPTGEPMLAVGNEVSGTTTIFAINTIPAPADTELQILGINDFHGRLEADAYNKQGGAAVLAGAVAQLKTENPNTLFVSAGDNIGASTFTSFSQQDEPTIDALLAAGLDASVVGNHEFDAGWDDLENRVRSSFGDPRYALGANVYLTGTKTPALDEYWVNEVDGVRVGFIGTVTEQTASMVSPAGIADVEFGDQLEAANRVAAQLHDGSDGNGEADVIVLLTHEGGVGTDCAAIGEADSLYGDLIRGASSDIDAILSGHTHAAYNCSYPVDGWTAGLERPVLQSGQYGMNLDQVNMTVNPTTKSVVSISSALLPLHDGTAGLYPADPAVAQIVSDAVEQADIVGSVDVGAISSDITRADGGADRGSESTLGNLVADIQLWATSNAAFGGEPAEIAFMNPGGVRDDLLHGSDGRVTYKQVANVQPFANTLVTMDLTGSQLRALLEEQWQPDGSSRAKLHLGVSEGFSYLYEPTAARGEHVVGMTLNGIDVAPTDVFRVATNSFLASGGDNFTTFAAGSDATDTGQVDLSATVEYFKMHALVDPAPLGRAVLAGTDWASIDVGDAVFAPGEKFSVTVSGLNPGQKITGTLHSTPVNLGTFAANSAGVVSFSAVIPADTTVGAHSLVISAVGLEPITVAVTVAATAAAAVSSTSAVGAIPALGVDLAPAGVAALLLLLGGSLLLARRRRQDLPA